TLPMAIFELREVAAPVDHRDLSVSRYNRGAFACRCFGIGLPLLAVPMMNTMFRGKPDLFTIQSEAAIPVTVLGGKIDIVGAAPPIAVPLAHTVRAPRAQPDRAAAGDADDFGISSRRR